MTKDRYIMLMVRQAIPEMTGRSLVQLARQIAAASHQEVNASKPLLSAALPSGARIQIVLPPAALDGGGFSIRRQVVQHLSLDDYAERGAEAYTFLQAVNIGHPGSISSHHADSPRAAFERLTLMVMQSGLGLRRDEIQEYIRAVVEVVVQMTRLPNGQRIVSEIYFAHAGEGNVAAPKRRRRPPTAKKVRALRSTPDEGGVAG